MIFMQNGFFMQNGIFALKPVNVIISSLKLSVLKIREHSECFNAESNEIFDENNPTMMCVST